MDYEFVNALAKSEKHLTHAIGVHIDPVAPCVFIGPTMKDFTMIERGMEVRFEERERKMFRQWKMADGRFYSGRQYYQNTY